MEHVTTEILVVDDDPLFRWSLAEALSAAGFDVLQAGDGTTARQLLSTRCVDLAICDGHLPDTTGPRLVEELHREHPGCPCFVVTSLPTEEGRRAAKAAGAIEYIEKPDDPELLVPRAAAALSSSAAAAITDPGADPPPRGHPGGGCAP